jgi:hypothetical protein
MLAVVLPLCLGLPAVFVVGLVQFGGAGSTAPPALAAVTVSMLTYALFCVAWIIWKLFPAAVDACIPSLPPAGLGGVV